MEKNTIFDNLTFEAPPEEFESRQPFLPEEDMPVEENISPEVTSEESSDDIPPLLLDDMLPALSEEPDFFEEGTIDIKESDLFPVLEIEGNNSVAEGDISKKDSDEPVSVSPSPQDATFNQDEDESLNPRPVVVKTIDDNANLEVQPEEGPPLPQIFFTSSPEIEEEEAGEGSISSRGIYIPVDMSVDAEAQEAENISESPEESLILQECYLRLASLQSQYRRLKGQISDIERHVSLLESLESFANGIQSQIEVLADAQRIPAWQTGFFAMRLPGPGQFSSDEPTDLLAWLAKEETWILRRMLPEMIEKAEEIKAIKVLTLLENVLSSCSFRRLVLESLIQGLEQGSLYKKENATVWLCLVCHCLHNDKEPPVECRMCGAGAQSFIEARGFSPYIMDREVFYRAIGAETSPGEKTEKARNDTEPSQ